MAHIALSNSGFLDAYGNNLYDAAQYAAIGTNKDADKAFEQLFRGTAPASVDHNPTDSLTIGLVLDRQADPTAAGGALSGNWAQRQAALADQSAVFATYGANPALYDATKAAIAGIVGNAALKAPTDLGYVSSAADRTVWVTITKDQFKELFGTDLLQVKFQTYDSKHSKFTDSSAFAWTGNLGINDKVPAGAIKGLWIEQSVAIPSPAIKDTTLVPLPAGPVGIGNSASNTVQATPSAIGDNYNFPLGANVATDPIAVVEPDVSNQTKLFNDLNAYRHAVGLPLMAREQFQVLSGGSDSGGAATGELTLDLSVVTDAIPSSTQLIYATLGGTLFTAYQQAFFDTRNDPSVLTSSYSVAGQPSAASPFQWAYQQLFVDGALSRVSAHVAGGDQGGGADIANGIANVANTHASPFALIVGGTSIASLYSAMSDSTLQTMLTLAQQNDPATVFMLVASGLKTLPSHLSAAAPPTEPLAPSASTTLTALFESVWQALTLSQVGNNLEGEFGANETGAGGIATNVAIPGYQTAFGVSSRTGSARGLPDVAALSSGNSKYAILNYKYVNGTQGEPLVASDGGTSAATPLWASLTTQFNAIFGNQGLPKLGFYNDLLYNAAVIAPGSFNDVQLGNNNNSYYNSDQNTGYFNTNTQLNMVPTNQGQAAAPGYDLASGLGTPNATLLARALTWIAHDQVSFANNPDLIHSNGFGGWVSGANQTVLFQTTAPLDGALIGINIGGATTGSSSQASAAFAWTSRLAEQSLQLDFDPSLAILFDKQAQGMVTQSQIGAGQSLAVSIDANGTQATQATFSSSFGFADFFSGADSVRAARAVAVAETVGAHNDQLAVVRVRQVGTDSLALTFYKVDDFNGSIGNLHPGDAGYLAALQARAYQLTSGGTSLNGPGYGQYTQSMLQHVNAGDLIAMQLADRTSGAVYSAFTRANETVNGQQVTHLWNYGVNTWGWEDTFGGGDRDYNDMVVQIDPTSAYANGWLI